MVCTRLPVPIVTPFRPLCFTFFGILGWNGRQACIRYNIPDCLANLKPNETGLHEMKQNETSQPLNSLFKEREGCLYTCDANSTNHVLETRVVFPKQLTGF